MTEMNRIRFERLYRSVHGDKHNLTRSHLGYQDAVVDRAFFFWLEGRERSMKQVTQLTIPMSLMSQSRNLQLAIIELAKKRNLSPEQFRAHLNAIDMLAREAHDLIVDAEYEHEGEGHDSLSRRPNNA